MNLNKNWHIIITDSAKKNFRRLPKNDSKLIEKAIDQMELNPYLGDIVKLGGEENSWRRRVGSYRIIFEILFEKNIIYIYQIKRRVSKTY
ncbi:MAG: type II toxin-antitoxin system RelE/ParE family toxin [Parcubacteria group bacterium]|nr:type II toxin-antitoxin system RelE/ParE family toxin [Parcubacteria group bacterium]